MNSSALYLDAIDTVRRLSHELLQLENEVIGASRPQNHHIHAHITRLKGLIEKVEVLLTVPPVPTP